MPCFVAKDPCIPEPPSQKHFARWQHRAAPACPPAGAFTIWLTDKYGYGSKFAVISPPDICARPGRRSPHCVVKWRYAEVLHVAHF